MKTGLFCCFSVVYFVDSVLVILYLSVGVGIQAVDVLVKLFEFSISSVMEYKCVPYFLIPADWMYIISLSYFIALFYTLYHFYIISMSIYRLTANVHITVITVTQHTILITATPQNSCLFQHVVMT